ncbi:MAG: hypothetical protein QOC98_2009, partial [Frankiaceae bacterium]|nr:hypothetical protein [Frankiaceae bacterium]
SVVRYQLRHSPLLRTLYRPTARVASGPIT